MHLVVNPVANARGIAVPPVIHFFCEGWNGFKFIIDNDRHVMFVSSYTETEFFEQTSRIKAMYAQAALIADSIENMIEERGGLLDFVDYIVAINVVVWSE